jgi:alcohol dehydrogenase, propanol-preferring
MLAARLHAPGEPLRLEQVELPDPQGTEVRVRVAACGVCHTDLHITRGVLQRVELPLTLGHEIAGWVDAWGADAAPELRAASLRNGDPVLVFGGWGCGSCVACSSGQEQRCADGRSPGFQEDGGYAEAVVVPHPRHLVTLGSLDPVRAAPLADAGLTPYRAVRRAEPWLDGGARVLLIGLGGLGQFALQYLRRLPDLQIAVRELEPDKVNLAADLGADLGLLGGDAALVRDGLGGAAHVVFDLVGSDESLELAGQVVAADGLIMLVGEAGGHLRFGFDLPSVESWLTTTAWGSLDELRQVVRLARRGALHWNIESMPLVEAQAALDRVAAGNVDGRIVLVPTVNS